jgi:hypothetical protein
MNIFCKIFGHWWDKSDKYRQPCIRCLAVRYRTVDKIKYAYGEKAVGWIIFDFKKTLNEN